MASNEPAPSKRRGLRPRREVVDPVASDPIAEAMKPLTDEERQRWTGWVELESDPALFNFILREYGVKGVKVQEVLGLESSLLDMLPQPVYGLIFLYKYRDEDEECKGEESPKCPRHVWFANQTVANACSTIALLNIVMNIPEIDLGDALSTFKTETRRLTPPYRGKRLGNDAFIRNIHNSFARRMDMLNADLALFNEMEKWKKAQKSKSNGRRKPAKKRKTKEEDEEPAFHFVAYVPIDGVVWRLDGLQRQPENLGAYQGDWMSVALPNISQHIYQYEQDGVQFNLLSLCKSPLRTCLEKLAENMHALTSIQQSLSAVQPDWRQFIGDEDLILTHGSARSFGISQELLDNPSLSDATQKQLEAAGSDVHALMALYQEYVRDQTQLQVSYLDEVALIGYENEQANRRKHDLTPVIYKSIKTLSEEGVLKEIVSELHDR